MKKLLLVASLAVAAVVAHAEANPAKKELVAKVLQLQQSGLEAAASQVADQPVLRMLQQASSTLQFRVPPEKRDAVFKDIQSDLKKYVDDTKPMLRERAIKLGPTTVGALLEEKFSEDELRQLIAIIESPVQRKFAQLGPEMQKALQEKLVADTRGQIEPKLKALDQSIAKRLNAALPDPAVK